MKAALWLLALFGVAVAIALFAGNNQGTVTVFWPPYRVDLSLNLVLLLLFARLLSLDVLAEDNPRYGDARRGRKVEARVFRIFQIIFVPVSTFLSGRASLSIQGREPRPQRPPIGGTAPCGRPA